MDMSSSCLSPAVFCPYFQSLGQSPLPVNDKKYQVLHITEPRDTSSVLMYFVFCKISENQWVFLHSCAQMFLISSGLEAIILSGYYN